MHALQQANHIRAKTKIPPTPARTSGPDLMGLLWAIRDKTNKTKLTTSNYDIMYCNIWVVSEWSAVNDTMNEL